MSGRPKYSSISGIRTVEAADTADDNDSLPLLPAAVSEALEPRYEAPPELREKFATWAADTAENCLPLSPLLCWKPLSRVTRPSGASGEVREMGSGYGTQSYPAV